MGIHDWSQNDPIKVFFEEVLGLVEIKEGNLTNIKNNPIHNSYVQVESFYITKTPLKIELWKILMDDRERKTYRRRVEWDDYLLLLQRLKELTKVEFSFPSSIQWEYATSICNSVIMPSYKDENYWSYVSVGLFDFHKGQWCVPSDVDLPYLVLCSMGNGHEELFLFLATKDSISTFNYTKEETLRISDIISNYLK